MGSRTGRLQRDHNKCRSTAFHRSRNQYVVNHSRGLPKIGNKVQLTRQSPGSVRLFCSGVYFWTVPSEMLCRDVITEVYHALQRYPSYLFRKYNRFSLAFVRIYPSYCAKFINLLAKCITPNRSAIKGRAQCTSRRLSCFLGNTDSRTTKMNLTFPRLHMHELRVFGSLVLAQKWHSSQALSQIVQKETMTRRIRENASQPPKRRAET